MTENALQLWIKQYYQYRNWIVIRVQAGKWQTIDGNWMVGADKGAPDLILINPDGDIYFTEVKTEKGKQSPEQLEWEKRASERGLKYVLIHNQREAWEKLEGYKGEEMPF